VGVKWLDLLVLTLNTSFILVLSVTPCSKIKTQKQAGSAENGKPQNKTQKEVSRVKTVEKCCYSDIDGICLNPAFELRGMKSCKPETCDLYYESAWYFTVEETKKRVE